MGGLRMSRPPPYARLQKHSNSPISRVATTLAARGRTPRSGLARDGPEPATICDAPVRAACPNLDWSRRGDHEPRLAVGNGLSENQGQFVKDETRVGRDGAFAAGVAATARSRGAGLLFNPVVTGRVLNTS